MRSIIDMIGSFEKEVVDGETEYGRQR